MLERLISADREILVAVNGLNSPFWDSFMWNYSQLAVWIPLVLSLLWVIYRNNSYKETLLIAAGLAVAFVLADQISSGFFKPVFHRFRPTHDPELAGAVRIVNGYRGGLYGFVSSHAANSFAAVTFCILLFRSRMTGILLVLWALLNCYSRMYLGVHFPGDIICGALVGIFSGCVAFRFCIFLRKRFLDRTSSGSFRELYIIHCVLGFTVLMIAVAGFAGFYV